jgi:hypothetical protein
MGKAGTWFLDDIAYKSVVLVMPVLFFIMPLHMMYVSLPLYVLGYDFCYANKGNYKLINDYFMNMFVPYHLDFTLYHLELYLTGL